MARGLHPWCERVEAPAPDLGDTSVRLGGAVGMAGSSHTPESGNNPDVQCRRNKEINCGKTHNWAIRWKMNELRLHTVTQINPRNNVGWKSKSQKTMYIFYKDRKEARLKENCLDTGAYVYVWEEGRREGDREEKEKHKVSVATICRDGQDNRTRKKHI